MVREIVLITMFLGFLGFHGFAADQRALDRARVTFEDGTVVSLEVADTEAKRNRGLMFRETLAETDGMLFVFDAPGDYAFWMQNCLIALDIVWLDSAFRVASIAESVPPCRLPGCEPPCASANCPTYPPAAGTAARYVVELAAGFAKRHGVRTGQTLAVRLPPNRGAGEW